MCADVKESHRLCVVLSSHVMCIKERGNFFWKIIRLINRLR